jgi:DNA-damage-inducible protein D
LSGILYERGVDDKGFAIVRSKGDQALFLLSTQQLKKKMGVPDSRPIADFLPTINSSAVRSMLLERGIQPENLPPAEDVKKLQRKLDSDEKKVLKDTKKKT